MKAAPATCAIFSPRRIDDALQTASVQGQGTDGR